MKTFSALLVIYRKETSLWRSTKSTRAALCTTVKRRQFCRWMLWRQHFTEHLRNWANLQQEWATDHV